MKKTITVNLNGKAYQLEEDGHDVFRAYLDAAGAKLQGNPDREEILADLEQAIGDKCAARLNASKDVVTGDEARAIIAEMGPIDAQANPEQAAEKDSTSKPPRRLYRISEGAMIGGVCTGLAAYFGIDVTLVRVIFVILAIASGGAWAMVYLAMMFIIPGADTAEQKAAATGAPFNAQEVLNRVRTQLNEAADKQGWREKRREFRRQIRESRRAAKAAWQDYGLKESRWAANTEWHARSSPFLAILSFVLAILWISLIIRIIAVGGGIFVGTFIPVWLGVFMIIIAVRSIFRPWRLCRRPSGCDHEVESAYRWSGLAALVELLTLLAMIYGGWFLYQNNVHFHAFIMDIANQFRTIFGGVNR